MRLLMNWVSLVVVCCLSSCSVGSSDVGLTHPSDELMIRQFRKEQERFETLVKMLNKEKNLVEISLDSVIYERRQGENIQPKRLKLYRIFIEDLGLESIRMDSQNEKIRLVASLKGLLLVSSEKSYVYSTFDQTPLVDSLDEFIRSNRFEDQPPIYKRISPNWYLFYESW